jgi:4-hydroxybenzoate polyprenyltransferase
MLSRGQVWGFVLVSSALLVASAGMLNPLCLALSPLALAVVFAYSYTKRFTALSHLVLGLALGIAPVGAWIAVTGRFALVPVVLATAVDFWVAGFDTIYACQDVDFDRGEGLHSLPVRLGVAGALLAARIFHGVCFVLLGSVYLLVPLHPVYLLGVVGVGALLVYEHSLVSPGDLSRVNAAFFSVNGWVSLGYMATTVVAVWLT